MGVSVKITGIEPLNRLFRNLDTRDVRVSVMKMIAEQMRSMQITHFEKEEDEYGQSWAPLSPGRIKQRSKRVEGAIYRRIGRELKMSGVTLRSKGKIRGARRAAAKQLTAMADMPILRDTGRLVNSLSTKASSNNAIVGTNVIYAATHQYGLPSKNIPKRTFLYLTEPERGVLLDRIDWELVYRKLQKS